MNRFKCSFAIAVIAVFQLRMYAASPTSFSASLDNEKSFFTASEDDVSLPENAATTENFVSHKHLDDVEPSEKQKQNNFIRNIMHNINFESLNNKDFVKTDYAVKSEQEVIEKECGINIEDYLKISENTEKDLNDFCFKNIRRFSPKDLLRSSIYHEDQRKCNTFLCAWYSERCEQVMRKEHKFDLVDVRIKKTQVSDPVMEKCKCFYRMWNQCGCDSILKNEKKDTHFKVTHIDKKTKTREGFEDFKAAVDKYDVFTDDIDRENSKIKTEEHITDVVETNRNVEDVFQKSDAKLKSVENVEEYSSFKTDNEVKMTKRDNVDASNKADMKSVDSDYLSDQASVGGNPNESIASINTRSGKADDDEDSIVFSEDEDAPSWDKVMPTPAVKSDPFDRESYSKEERNCFVVKAVWFNGQCAELNSVSPCKKGEWLVLERPADNDELLKPICKPKPCEDKNEVSHTSPKYK